MTLPLNTTLTLASTGRKYTVREIIAPQRVLGLQCQACGKKFSDAEICPSCASNNLRKIHDVVPYCLKDFIPEIDKADPIVFYVAKPLAGREIYFGDILAVEAAMMFEAAGINIDLSRYYHRNEIEIIWEAPDGKETT